MSPRSSRCVAPAERALSAPPQVRPCRLRGRRPWRPRCRKGSLTPTPLSTSASAGFQRRACSPGNPELRLRADRDWGGDQWGGDRARGGARWDQGAARRARRYRRRDQQRIVAAHPRWIALPRAPRARPRARVVARARTAADARSAPRRAARALYSRLSRRAAQTLADRRRLGALRSAVGGQVAAEPAVVRPGGATRAHAGFERRRPHWRSELLRRPGAVSGAARRRECARRRRTWRRAGNLRPRHARRRRARPRDGHRVAIGARSRRRACAADHQCRRTLGRRSAGPDQAHPPNRRHEGQPHHRAAVRRRAAQRCVRRGRRRPPPVLHSAVERAAPDRHDRRTVRGRPGRGGDRCP